MKIIFENKYRTEIENPTIKTHEAVTWYYDDIGDFHLVLRKLGGN